MTTNMPSLPALSRNFYEARREVLAAAGVTATPWYQLSAEERQVVDAETRIIIEALRRTQVEQEAREAVLARHRAHQGQEQPVPAAAAA
ncbi:hypothetical protein ACIP9H_34005 [Streptomyces sp. NPDC088732]|uniref:hypothetical protein n=1 Tax=Streptomyces sp. NPDC088732 TaxID=3365879 RepID=UPI0037F7C8D0